MNKAQYYLSLRGRQINGQSYECLGSQFVAICRVLQDQYQDLVWYVTDVHAVMPFEHMTPSVALKAEDVIKKQNSYAEFEHDIGQVMQFESGVFIAVPGGVNNPRFRANPGTEDYQDEDLGDALFELRAFDTGAIEVYAAKKEHLMGLSNKYSAEILESESSS